MIPVELPAMSTGENVKFFAGISVPEKLFSATAGLLFIDTIDKESKAAIVQINMWRNRRMLGKY
jgi:hypothetical protein